MNGSPSGYHGMPPPPPLGQPPRDVLDDLFNPTAPQPPHSGGGHASLPPPPYESIPTYGDAQSPPPPPHSYTNLLSAGNGIVAGPFLGNGNTANAPTPALSPQPLHSGGYAQPSVYVPQLSSAYLPQLQPDRGPQPTFPQPLPQVQPNRSQEDEDRAQLEKIIQLRRELELEQEREQQKRHEMLTWACAECTFRSKMEAHACEMCGTARPGFRPPPQQSSVTPAPVAAPTVSVGQPAGPTAWQCSMCLAPNEAHDARCRACSAYRKSGVPVPLSSSPGQGPGGGGSTRVDVPSRTPFTTDWRCSMCGTVNHPSSSNCVACSSYQYNGTPIAGAAAPQVLPSAPQATTPAMPSTWPCSVCTFENGVQDAVCQACRSGQRPRHLAPPGDHRPSKKSSAAGTGTKSDAKQWLCSTCTFINLIARSKCDMCGAARPSSCTPAASAKDTANKKREAESDEDEIQWQDDAHATKCNRCHQPFGLMRRRHHCRACGYVFCATCSPFQIPLKRHGEPERVCANCYEARKSKTKP